MFDFDAGDAISALSALRQRLEAERPTLLRAIGRRVLDRAHGAFVVKSAGGTGEDGIQWPPLTPRYVRQRKTGGAIGVRSGVLRDPRFDLLDVHESRVRVGFDDPHAEFFDERRPLMPARLPDRWYREANSMVQAAVDAAAESLRVES